MDGTIRIIIQYHDASLGIPYAVEEKINKALKYALLDTLRQNYAPFDGTVEIHNTFRGAGES